MLVVLFKDARKRTTKRKQGNYYAYVIKAGKELLL